MSTNIRHAFLDLDVPGTTKISATSTTWKIPGVARCMPFATACGRTATSWSWAFATTMMWSGLGWEGPAAAGTMAEQRLRLTGMMVRFIGKSSPFMAETFGLVNFNSIIYPE